MGGILTPPQQLVGWARVPLNARASQAGHRLVPHLGARADAGGIDGTARPQVQSGNYQVQVGSDTAMFTIH